MLADKNKEGARTVLLDALDDLAQLQPQAQQQLPSLLILVDYLRLGGLEGVLQRGVGVVVGESAAQRGGGLDVVALRHRLASGHLRPIDSMMRALEIHNTPTQVKIRGKDCL